MRLYPLPTQVTFHHGEATEMMLPITVPCMPSVPRQIRQNHVVRYERHASSNSSELSFHVNKMQTSVDIPNPMKILKKTIVVKATKSPHFQRAREGLPHCQRNATNWLTHWKTWRTPTLAEPSSTATSIADYTHEWLNSSRPCRVSAACMCGSGCSARVNASGGPNF